MRKWRALIGTGLVLDVLALTLIGPSGASQTGLIIKRYSYSAAAPHTVWPSRSISSGCPPFTRRLIYAETSA